ncbi:MAG: bifunctional phosphoribosylaminoimidazolecarboxamide formyltransferase/IMP cyclohydrolase [Ignavibacteria bacterium]|nr:bifunctional phosphoribosylaminoimidazolecarboxamide formyltransferase/IMP cyclohydrolase [Ignavibacteria bacterium]
MKRALISVYDKTGIAEFAVELVSYGYEIVSTSRTAQLLRDVGLNVKSIEEITNIPEMLDGRVKTLQYQIFAGILADREDRSHMEDVERLGLPTFDLVCVNLYPFADTIKKKDCSEEEAIEQIDIGGVSLIRAAAKNYRYVSVIVSPSQYKFFIDSVKKEENVNRILASEAFYYVSLYDLQISEYFRKGVSDKGIFYQPFKTKQELRYGENPHQKAWLYNAHKEGFSDIFKQLHGKELSYVNVLDIDASYRLIKEFSAPTCAIIKHASPCGVASGSDIREAYEKAFSSDTVSPFGGIIIFNRRLDLNTAVETDKVFTEIIIAPDYDDDALEFLFRKKNRRIIKYDESHNLQKEEFRSITGGIIYQDSDIFINESDLRVVTKRYPTENEKKDMIFAMKVCKHVKSNAVVFVKDFKTLGIGSGQTSRVDSTLLAVSKAERSGHSLAGSAVASDAFFPFADSIAEISKTGASSVIQPGGSVRDEEVIHLANEKNLTMIFTGLRHFKH